VIWNIFIVATKLELKLENGEVFLMADRNFLGGVFNDDCAILFFILVFLLLFVSPRGLLYADPK